MKINITTLILLGIGGYILYQILQKQAQTPEQLREATA